MSYRGRPSTYDPAYCDEIIDLMAQGKSIAAFAAKLRVSRQTLYNWAAAHAEFAEAMAIGKDLALAWWEDVTEQNAIGEKSGNASVINFQMKNRFKNDYRDTQDYTLGGGDNPLEIDNRTVIEFIMPEGVEE